MSLFKNSTRLNKSWIFLFILTIINLGLVFLPLTNSLGYEFSAVNSIILFLLGGFYFLIEFAKIDSSSQDFLQLILSHKKIVTSFYIVPLIIGSISTIFLSRCPIKEGFVFYLIITLPGFIGGFVFAYLSYFINKRLSPVIFLAIFLIIALSSILEIYRYPEVSFYNLLIGYFPGTVYDEDLRVDNLLLAYRIFNIAFYTIIVFTVDSFFQNKYKRKRLALLFLMLISAAFYFIKPRINLATDELRLDGVLNKQIVTDHFNIHFSDSSLTKNEFKFAALLHEYYLEYDNRELNIKYNKRIDSYIFKGKNQKRELIGAGNANLAKPWLSQIYLNKSSYSETLKHELVHIISSKFGVTPFKIADNFNSALLEGLAMAVENNYDGYPVHYLAALAYKANYRVQIEKLFSGMNFFMQASTVSYVYAGSFVRFLIDKYGVNKIKKLYSNMDFKTVLGKDISLLARNYIEFLSGYEINFNKYKAQLYFSGQTIFKKFCPRIAASDNKKADLLFNQGKIDDALQLYKSIYSYSNLFNSLVGIINCYSKQKKYEEAERYLSNEMVKFRKSQYFFYLELIEGDLLVETGKPNDAVAIYDSLLVQNPHVEYDNSVRIRKAFLMMNSDSLKNFLTATNAVKRSMLYHLNNNAVNCSSIPYLIALKQGQDTTLTQLLVSLKENIETNSFTAAYALLNASKYFLINGDYKTAKLFAVSAVSINSNKDEKHRFIENLKMVNWFNNFADEYPFSMKYEN